MLVGVEEELLERLGARGLRLAIAEGDTGGVVLASLTAVAGSSRVVLGGVVAYADALKRGVLEVETALLERHGAVSAEVAQAMAEGVRRLAGADVGLATTGIAGPGGATLTKPVGLAFVAVATPELSAARRYMWSGDREQNRRASARAALQLVLEVVAEK